MNIWPGWSTSAAPRRLLWAATAVVLLPWTIGEYLKTFHQPGIDDDWPRSLLMIDYLIIGSTLFGLSMVIACTFGCWIVAVMRGPRRDGDPFPGDRGRPPPDD